MLLNEQSQIFLNIFLMNCKTNILTIYFYLFCLPLKRNNCRSQVTNFFLTTKVNQVKLICIFKPIHVKHIWLCEKTSLYKLQLY